MRRGVMDGEDGEDEDGWMIDAEEMDGEHMDGEHMDGEHGEIGEVKSLPLCCFSDDEHGEVLMLWQFYAMVSRCKRRGRFLFILFQ
jgi:hypothetical protein